MSRLAGAVRRLADLTGGEFRPPATEADIDRFQAAAGVVLPPEVRELYLTADGFGLVPGASVVMSLEEAEPLAAQLNRPGGHLWGFVPLTEAHDSDSVSVYANLPLKGYVTHVLHDDSPRLLHRTLTDFLSAVADRLAADPEWYDLHELASAFDGSDRTADDRRIARELLAEAAAMPPPADGGPPPADLEHAYDVAIRLLGEDDLEVLRPLLEYDGWYSIPQFARARLAGMASPAAARMLADYQAEVDRFAERLAADLSAAGVAVTLTRDPAGVSLRVGPGAAYFGVDGFFPWRHRPDGYAQVVQQIRETLAERGRRP